MKKYLIISMDIDLSAPGIVFGKIIREMQKTCELSILCPVIPDGFKEHVKIITCLPYNRFNFRFERLLLRYLGHNISDIRWAKKVYLQTIDNCKKETYDGIISFTSSNDFASLYLGQKLSTKLEKKWIIYSVDAIPTPLDWNPDARLHNNVAKQLRSAISKADAFYAANPIMLQYEIDLFGNFNGNTGVILTPHDNKGCNRYVEHEGISFLYTGNIYGPRKVDSLIAAFAKFNEENPKSKLIFVGKFFGSIQDQYQCLVDEGRIVFHGFTDNLTPHYENADVLIDIASIHPNDVFLSSKIVNYLPVKKPIIAISGQCSPVRLLLGNIPTIIQCQHDSNEIYNSLCASSKLLDSDFSDRKNVIHLFSVKTVVTDFMKTIETV